MKLNLRRSVRGFLIAAFLILGVHQVGILSLSLGKVMNDDGTQGSAGKHGIDPLAMEAAHEVSKSFLNRFRGIYESSLNEEQQEQEIEKLLNETNVRVNEIYQQKKASPQLTNRDDSGPPKR